MAGRRGRTAGGRLRAVGLLIVGVLALAGLASWGVIRVLIPPGPERTGISATAGAPAQQLASADGGVGLAADYQAVLDSLAGKCTQDEAGIAALVNSAQGNLSARGMSTATRLSMLQYLDGQIAPGAPKADCGPLLSTYVASRQQ